jgi:hypothetical protein
LAGVSTLAAAGSSSICADDGAFAFFPLGVLAGGGGGDGVSGLFSISSLSFLAGVASCSGLWGRFLPAFLALLAADVCFLLLLAVTFFFWLVVGVVVTGLAGDSFSSFFGSGPF